MNDLDLDKIAHPPHAADANHAVAMLEEYAGYRPAAYTAPDGWEVHFAKGGPTGKGKTFTLAAYDAVLQMEALAAKLEERGLPRLQPDGTRAGGKTEAEWFRERCGSEAGS